MPCLSLITHKYCCIKHGGQRVSQFKRRHILTSKDDRADRVNFICVCNPDV